MYYLAFCVLACCNSANFSSNFNMVDNGGLRTVDLYNTNWGVLLHLLLSQ